ncbi:hypothetical protein KGF54_002875 [Candida jiufengensis]|uniref:uncharacterized protein n=1 Tax=Candida jiufengensis TaxID=497108 RepID=UPI002224B380|nr:uncharacterized protein KGF54_002875 [Candida jiufengensis]KAI5953503.1 hypothetical protein KGF54_002875 [Candida jiufengensis]
MSYNNSLENLLGSKYFTSQSSNNNLSSNNDFRKSSLAATTTTTNSINNSSSFTNPDDFITYIIPDFNAVKYFQKDFVNSNEFYLIEESEVNGFELYICEQWVINRNIGTIVTAYTGNETSKISVVKFTIIKKPTKYYPIRFQEYLTELIQNHSRMKTVDKERPQQTVANSRANSTNDIVTIAKISSKPPMVGERKDKQADFTNEVCFVTNLTSLPPNLNLIPIASGDARTIEAPFIINSDLKKLQCTGRSVSLTTDKISDASDDKFRQMYKIYNVKVPIKFAVRELVNVIQTCLFYFDLLDGRYCTGLLCVKTEEAINNWWNLIGLPHFNTKPNARFGILPATTVAAIISLILSIRLRLQLVGVSDVPKDPFDFENFLLAIGQFQRQSKLEKTRKLDMETMNKLFTITNARLMPEKSSNYFYTPYDLDETQDYDLLTSPKPVVPHKRTYGKRELKKLTNVMKNTVSDHINAASMRDSDDTTKSGGRIRNRIAKLADSVSPLDVETLDLDILMKNFLIGKTLLRLFHGVQSGNVLSDEQGKLRNNENRKSVNSNNDSYLYNFESLRDKIIQNHDIQINTKNVGFSRRFGLQSRKNLDDRLAPPTLDNNNRSIIARDRSLQSSSMVDSFLQIGDAASSTEEVRRPSSIDSSCVNTANNNSNHPLVQFKRDLNRRNSWPTLLNAKEENLNSFIHMKESFTFPSEYINICKTKPRSNSYTLIEKHFRGDDPSLESIPKFSTLYLKNIDSLMRYENLKNYYFETDQDVSNAALTKSFQLLNVDLMKVKNLKLQMMSNKHRVMEEGLVDHLKFNFNNLTGTVDRLSYETRIVSKKINELEENYKLYEDKLNTNCQKKLKKIIDQVLNSREFKELYTINERKSIAFELTNDENYVKIEQDDENMGIMRIIVVFCFELISTIFQWFKFERNNMNLERIRQSWVKLDPQKSVIKRTYSYIGRQPSSDSIASAELNQ